MNNIRDQINFNEKVKKAFSFLPHEYHFHLLKEESTFVRYASDRVFINIYHGRTSYEIGVEMGLLRFEEKVFRLPTIIEAVASQNTERVMFQAGDPKVVEKCLINLSKIIKEHCEPLLLGHEDAWEKVSIQAQLNAERLNEKYSVSPIKENADKAWHEKRYDDVVKLYASVEHYLTNAERKRLAFAKKQFKT